MFLISNKSYGLLILTVILGVGLYTAYDAQASIMRPGWMAGLRASAGVRSPVWCRTVVYGQPFQTATFFHYPGKSLTRVMEELGVPLPIRSLYLKPDNRQETTCFDTWKEAALANAKFQVVAQDYAELLAGWTEEDYQKAVLMINLQKGGMARLTEILKLKQRSFEQSRQSR